MLLRLLITILLGTLGSIALLAQNHNAGTSGSVADTIPINQLEDTAYASIPKTGIFNSARSLEPGQAYYQNSMLFYNELGLGLSRHLSVSAILVPTFENIFTLLNIRVSVPVHENFTLSAGGSRTNLGYLLDEGDSRNTNYFNLAAGWHNETWDLNLGYFTNGFYGDDAESSFMVINGAYLLNRDYSFAAEAFINFDGLVSFGTLSFQIHYTHFDLQLGFIPLFTNEFLASPPWFCIRYKFKAW